MPDWWIFQEDRDYVTERFKKGFVDYIEVVGKVAEMEFFRYFLGNKHLQFLADLYPTPRKKEEVPVWLYLASELTLRLHGAMGYGGYPYIIHCGGLRSALGPKQARIRKGEEGKEVVVCEGYNDKNHYTRQTPCDRDYVRKMAKDTDAVALEDWFGIAVPQLYQRMKVLDREGIFILDGSYLFVPDNPNYKNSSVMCFDEHNHPVSQKERERLSPERQKRCRFRRSYRAVSLLHTNREQEFFLYAGAKVMSGSGSESPQTLPLVEQFVRSAGAGAMKLLIFDRGFIDGATTTRLKTEFGIDTVFPLRKDMLAGKDAWVLADYDDAPWQVWRPPEPVPAPEPPDRPEPVRKRERKRQETLKKKKREQRESGELPPPPPQVERVELKAIRNVDLWESCSVPVHVVLVRKHLTDGSVIEWALATTRKFNEPLEIWEDYQLRPSIEERHRQIKCFWDLAKFRSTDFSRVVNHVTFVLLAYSLMQVFLIKNEQEKLSSTTRQRLMERLLPYENKVAIYVDQRVGFYTGPEEMLMTLKLTEGPRRRMTGTLEKMVKGLMLEPWQPMRPSGNP